MTKSNMTVVMKSSSQLVVDDSGSARSSKSDLQTILVEPASNGAGAFMMLPEFSNGKSDLGTATVAECPPSSLTADETRLLVEKIAGEELFDSRFALAVAQSESAFNVNALSDKGAFGALQLTLSTATDLGVNRCVPAENIRGGIKYLKSLQQQFGNPVYVLAAYNAGPNAVVEQKGVPPYGETIGYIARVLNLYYGRPAMPQQQVAASAAPRPNNKVRVPAKADAAWSGGFVMHIN